MVARSRFPQRLGQFVIVEAPWYFHLFYRAISPFIDKAPRPPPRLAPLLPYIDKARPPRRESAHKSNRDPAGRHGGQNLQCWW